MPPSKIAIGIDLGTSNSCVGIARDGPAQIIVDTNGAKTHSSIVAFRKNGSIVVGNAAKPLLITEPETTVSSAKRLMGRFFFSDEVRKAQTRYAYKLVDGPNHAVRIHVHDQHYSPEDIAALVLKRLKTIAEKALGERIAHAVVTVPAYFNDNQRQATRDAGRISGLKILRIINEPTAAALAYGYGQDQTQRVAVYDFGGGTFDVSILEIGKETYEVLATSGDTYLGGDDIDERIVAYLVKSFHNDTGIDLRGNRAAIATLAHAAEVGKKQLSTEPNIDFHLPQICHVQGKTYDLQATLTQSDLSRLSSELIQRTFKVTDEALQGARMMASSLDGVILVGGPTRLPFLRQAVTHYFQKEPLAGMNPDHVVALGAALQANALVQAGPPTILLDVTPLSLRLATVGDYNEVIIEKNTPIPIERTRTFTTVRDNQEKVQVVILQGESGKTSQCVRLGQFEFSGLRPAPRGDVKIEVTFEIDVDGIVNVSAKDVETQRTAKTTLSLSGGMSEKDLEASQLRFSDAELIEVSS